MRIAPFAHGPLGTAMRHEHMQEAARRNVANFRKYRHLLSQDLYHLAQVTGSNDWTVTEFCTRDGSEAVLLPRQLRGAHQNGATQGAPASSGSNRIG